MNLFSPLLFVTSLMSIFSMNKVVKKRAAKIAFLVDFMFGKLIRNVVLKVSEKKTIFAK